jgi:hypothetical protein
MKYLNRYDAGRGILASGECKRKQKQGLRMEIGAGDGSAVDWEVAIVVLARWVRG